MLKNSIIFTLEDIAKYPFSRDAKEYISNINITIKDLGTIYGAKILERSYQRIIDAIKKRVGTITLYPDLDIEILSFPTAILLVKLVNDPLLFSRFSIAESKRAAIFLRYEDNEKIIYLATTTFNWKLILNNKYTKYKAYTFIIDFPSYLANIPEYSPPWKLANRIMFKGNVLLSKHDIVRLLEEAIKKHILIQLTKKQELQISERSIAEWVDKVKDVWIKYKSKIKLYKPVKMSEEAYPPCIVNLIENVKAGKNISHVGRFALASFLINIGMSPDEVLEFFKTSPDFNESIARYQIEHIAGLRGSRIRYSPFKCENMKSYGLCQYNEDLCKGIKHPLQYYYKKIFRRKHGHEVGRKS